LKEASKVFRSVQRHDSRHNQVKFHSEARWLSRGKVLERVRKAHSEIQIMHFLPINPKI